MENKINVNYRNWIAQCVKTEAKLQKAQDRYAENAIEKPKDAHEYHLGNYVMLGNFDSTEEVSLKLIPWFE